MEDKLSFLTIRAHKYLGNFYKLYLDYGQISTLSDVVVARKEIDNAVYSIESMERAGILMETSVKEEIDNMIDIVESHLAELMLQDNLPLGQGIEDLKKEVPVTTSADIFKYMQFVASYEEWEELQKTVYKHPIIH